MTLFNSENIIAKSYKPHKTNAFTRKNTKMA